MKKKSDKKFTGKGLSNALTYRLMMILNLTFFSFTLIMLLLYIVGNYQQFLDLTQKIILTTLSYTSVFCLSMSVILAAETFIKIFTEKKKAKNIINLLFLIAVIIISLIELVFSSTMNFVSQGMN